MVYLNTGPAKDRHDEILETLEQLVRKIDSAKSLAVKSKSRQCLVELESAAMTVSRLRTLVSNWSASKRLNWSTIVEAVAFIAKVVEKLYSFLRCNFIIGQKYEDWITHQTSADDRRYIANAARG